MLCVMLCVNLSEIAVCCALCELIRNTVWTYQKCCVWVYLKCCGTEEDDLHNYFNPLLTKLQDWKGYQNVWSKPENLNFWFPAQPHGYRGARVQKHSKKSRKSSKTPKFTMFFVSSSSVPTWSRWKPKNSSSLAHSGHFDTLCNPVGLSIVDWNNYIDHLTQCTMREFDNFFPLLKNWNLL